MRNKTISPLLLTNTCNLNNRSGIAVGVSDIDRLRNPARTPFLLGEIRFILNGTLRLAGPWMTWVRLDLGRVQLTAGRFIPIPLLCTVLDPTLEVTAFPVGACLPAGGAGLGNDPYGNIAACFTWRLPKPLYIPAGETVIPQFFLNGDGIQVDTLAATNVDIVYVGRALSVDAPMPETVDMPFVTAWIDTPRAGAANYLSIRSMRSDLKNPFAEPVYVQRMLGTYFRSLAPGQAGHGNLAPGMGLNGANSIPLDDVAQDLVTTRIVKSNGTVIVKDATPWGVLFPPMTRSFEMCGVLKRNEFYMLSSDIKLATGLGNMPATARYQFMASIIGYRKVAYARGSGFVEAA